MINYQKEFIANLKFYRNLKNLSQAKLAELCDCGNGTIGAIESGRQFPSFDLLFRIANVLEIHPADLFLRNTSKTSEYNKELLEQELIPSIQDFIHKHYS